MIIKKSKLPTLLGIVLLVAATLTGVLIINRRQVFRLGAAGDFETNDVRISNVSDASFTVSWTTNKESVGFVTIDGKTSDETQKGYTHLINVVSLKPETSYNFKINSNGTTFDNNGIPWQAKTATRALNQGNLITVSGSALTATGEPLKKAIVYISLEGNLFSTITSDSGNYVLKIPVGDPENTLLEIFIQSGPEGVSSAQVYTKSTNPVPPMILGNTHDFRNFSPNSDSSAPSAKLNLPKETDQKSKFNITEGNNAPITSAAVTLQSINEGETVTSSQPEFFGEGPVGAELTVTIESESPITKSINISSNGKWNFSVPKELPTGTHKITITWKDVSGVTRSLTRNFIVQAGEAPAFEASGSGQTATPTPTSNPSPTPKASASPTSTSTPLPTNVPETGMPIPTLVLLFSGLGVIIFSFHIWKLAAES